MLGSNALMSLDPPLQKVRSTNTIQSLGNYELKHETDYKPPRRHGFKPATASNASISNDLGFQLNF